MLNRRHIRIKVMQSIYAFLLSKNNDIDKELKFLYLSINKLYELYVLQLNLLIETRNFATKRLKILQKNRITSASNKLLGTTNIKNNKLIDLIDKSELLNEFTTNKKLNIWQEDALEYLQVIWNDLIESAFFEKYNLIKNPTFEQDKQFTLDFYKKIIAPNNKLIDYFESQNIGWIDDVPFINTAIVKDINKIKNNKIFKLNELYKNQDDHNFVKELFNKTILNHADYDFILDELTPNWEFDRIANMDLILMKMAITEFLKFPSIPTKVTINEYLEIAKDYSSEKSGLFINGVLDKLLKKYNKEQKINKIGRGLF